ncbi:MAG: cytochrome P450 [Mycobacterium sp.]|nr:cytochrome P450 [Mycobacterium sp.]
MRERLHWLALHGVVRVAAGWAARRGDPQARLMADPAVRADPVSFYDEVRAMGPTVRTQVGYLTLDHGVAYDLLRSEDFRVITVGSTLKAPLRKLERATRSDLLHPLLPPSLLVVEPPDHTRYRKTVSSVFTTRAVAGLREGVEQTAAQLLDALDGSAGIVDVVARYCSQLPVAVISEILGVPQADRPLVLEFGELGAPTLDIGLSWPQYRRVQRGVAGFNYWLTDHVRRLREHPGDDLLSQLIRAADDGGRLDETELLGIAGLVLAAGFETTVNLLGNGIRMLLDAPDQLARLAADPSLWPGAVEEILRLDPPVRMAVRAALTDTDVAGTRVKCGDVVVLYLAAANRDPAVFDDPNRFDVGRANAGKHLSFSGGRHFCLGAALARAEGEVGLRRFFTHFPDVELAGPGTRRETRVLGGWAELPVTLGAPAAIVPR